MLCNAAQRRLRAHFVAIDISVAVYMNSEHSCTTIALLSQISIRRYKKQGETCDLVGTIRLMVENADRCTNA